MHSRACPTLGLDPGHHLGPARPGVGNTPGFTADGAVPGCPLHGEARVRPHLPPCAGYFTPYMAEAKSRKRALLETLNEKPKSSQNINFLFHTPNPTTITTKSLLSPPTQNTYLI